MCAESCCRRAPPTSSVCVSAQGKGNVRGLKNNTHSSMPVFANRRGTQLSHLLLKRLQLLENSKCAGQVKQKKGWKEQAAKKIDLRIAKRTPGQTCHKASISPRPNKGAMMPRALNSWPHGRGAVCVCVLCSAMTKRAGKFTCTYSGLGLLSKTCERHRMWHMHLAHSRSI